MTSGGGQRSSLRFMTRFERGVCVASTKGAGLARRGNSAVHRRSPSIRVYDQQNLGEGGGEKERARRREGSRKTRVNGPRSTAYKLQIRQAR